MKEIKGVEISNVFGLEEPLVKFFDIVARGVGKMYEPTHLKRMAKAKVKEIDLISEAITNNLELPIEYDKGDISIDSTSINNLIERTGKRFLYQELKKQQNLESIVVNAYKELQSIDNISSEPLDDDWIFNFFNFAGDVSVEEMQEIWGKILVGEIKKPNTYSLRTLNTLKNLSQEEAKLFQKLSQFIIKDSGGNPYIFNDLIIRESVSYNELLKLEDCGLMNLNGFTTLNCDEGEHLLYTEEVVAILEDRIEISVYNFTESGKQLLTLFDIKSNLEYVLKVFKNLKEDNSSIKVFNIIEKYEDSIEYDETIDLLNEK